MNSIKERLRSKLFLITAIPIIFFVILSIVYIIPDIRDNVFNAKKEQARELGEVGLSVVDYYHGKEQEGEMSTAEAQQAAIDTLREMRFGETEDDYYWILGYDHELMMHPYTTDLVGESLQDFQDPQGVYLAREMVEVAKEKGEGHVEYSWQYYDEEERIEPKISYVIGFEQWDWIIGTGVYMEDILPMVITRIVTIAVFIAGTVIVSFLVTWKLSHSMILQPVGHLVKAAGELGGGNLQKKVEVTSKDEIGQLGYAFNQMSENISYYQRQLQEQNKVLQAILDNAPVGIWLVDQEQKPVIVNQYFKDNTGMGTGVCSLTEEESAYCIMTNEEAFKKERLQQYEQELTFKDGKKHVIQTMKTRLLDEDGNVLGVLGLGVDITERKKMEEELIKSEKKFRTYIDKAPVGVFVVNREGEFLEVNEEACRMRGYTKKELLNSNITDIVHTDYLNVSRKHFQQVKEAGRAGGTLRGKRKDGSCFWYDNYAVKISDDLFISFQMDVTERIEKEKQIRRSEEKFKTLFEQNVVAIYLHDVKGNILDVNDEACSQLGYTRQELLKMTVLDLHRDEELKNNLLLQWPQWGQGERYYFEVEHMRKDGTLIPVEVSAGVISYDNKNIIMALVKDITARKTAEEKVIYLSFYDKLTGLYNRNYLEEEMDRLEKSRDMPVGVIMADLNGLKLVNDSYGHCVGDELLQKTADILRESCRREDIIARWGGDEFVILLPRVSEKNIINISRRIRENCHGYFVKDIPVSLAVGTGIKEDAGESFEDVLNEVESKMYKEKLPESRSTRSAVLRTLLKTLEEKSFETELHAERMLMFAWKIGERIGLPDSELNRLSLVITLHDIGKINIPEKTLTKRDSLTEEEWEMIKEHPEVGHRIAFASEEFAHIAEDILSHHERWDGTGYPRGLKEDEIPLLARITAIVDAYEVMSNGRPYKEPMSQEAIIEEFRRCSGTQFDPGLVEIFIEILQKE